MRLGILGAGYVGLTTGICLASLNHSITIFDIDSKKIENIKNSKMPFFENRLQELLNKVIDSKNLHTTSDIKNLIQNSDGCFICVGTPTNEDGSINVSQVIQAIETIIPEIKINKKTNYQIIIRSTMIPGTTRKIILPILAKNLNASQFSLCVAPEFLREGNAYHDFMNPDKIVIGGFNLESMNDVAKIFSNFKTTAKFIKTNSESAELIKYTNNAFFSMLISFANEIANISEQIKNVDSIEVLNALILDKRISTLVNNQVIIPEFSTYLIPGCGFGGSCLPKDVKAIVNFASSLNLKTPLLDATLQINDKRPDHIFSIVKSILSDLKNKKISVLGLTFKPETDDMRSSPSLEFIKLSKENGAEIFAYDPLISKNTKNLNLDCKISETLEDCLTDSDLAVLFTKWPQFKAIDSQFLKKYMKNPLILDGRCFLDAKNFDQNCFFKVGFKEKSD